MKINEILKQSISKLIENKVEEPILKARRLLAFVLNVKKEYLITHNQDEIKEEQVEQFKQCIKEIINGKPIQYILGYQEFMGIRFEVNESVLIPQPDTEILVEKVIEIGKRLTEPHILDLCTGSGAIAVALSKKLPQSKIVASDVSEKALNVAKENDKVKKIEFILSDMFESIKEKYDIIVSNPPYIKTETISNLSNEVQNEPMIALDGGEDGLVFYREIINKAYNFLNTEGYLCLEIGEDQRKQVIELISRSGKYNNVKAYKDLSGHDRVIICKKT